MPTAWPLDTFPEKRLGTLGDGGGRARAEREMDMHFDSGSAFTCAVTGHLGGVAGIGGASRRPASAGIDDAEDVGQLLVALLGLERSPGEPAAAAPSQWRLPLLLPLPLACGRHPLGRRENGQESSMAR